MSVLSKLYGLNHNGSTVLPYSCYEFAGKKSCKKRLVKKTKNIFRIVEKLNLLFEFKSKEHTNRLKSFRFSAIRFFFFTFTTLFSSIELGHTWTPHCTEASLTIASTVLRESLKMYSLLYFLSQIIFVRKFGYQHFKTTFTSIFRSTSFLTFNALSTLSFFCFSRHLAGKFYLPVVSHLPAMISSFMALKIERENRRSALAFYCANVAMETIIFGNLNVQNNIKQFNKKHGIVQRVPKQLVGAAVQGGFLTLIFNVFKINGDDFKRLSMYIFGVSSIIYLTKLNWNEQRLLKIERIREHELTGEKKIVKKEHADLVFVAFKYLIGEQELDDGDLDEFGKSDGRLEHGDTKVADNRKRIDNRSELKRFLNEVFSYSHRTSSECLTGHSLANCLKGSASCSMRGFTVGFLSNFTLILAFHLKNNNFKLKQSFWSLLTHRENFKFSLLLGTFNGFYKLFNCLLHRLEEKRSGWHPVASSIVGILLPKLLFGKAMASPNLNLTQYLFWKAMENWFWHFAKAHQLKKNQIHEKYLRIIHEEMSRRFAKNADEKEFGGKSLNERNQREFATASQKELIDSREKQPIDPNINLNNADQLKEKINKLTVNDTLQLKKLADKLTQIESKQTNLSVFNYISSDNLVSLIYSLSVSQLFYVAVMQPQTLRGSYMKWLNRCTDNRLRLLNRDIIDFFGVQSSAGFAPYEPVLDFKFTSRKFQEAIQVWTI